MEGHDERNAAPVMSHMALRNPSMLDLDDQFQGTAVPSRMASEIPTRSGVGNLVRIPESSKWAWGLRQLSPFEVFLDGHAPASEPRVGDVVVVRVDHIGYHSTIITRENRKLRIYAGDLLVGVLGNRYATDAYEAEVDGLDRLSLLTAGGMVGTVRSSHEEMTRPTSVSFVGFAVDVRGQRINLKDWLFHPAATETASTCPLLVVVGTGMNSGKTTVVSLILHGLRRQGVRVAAAKITGSVSNRDVDEMRSSDAVSVLDFSDYGFPSTYLADPGELALLWREILVDSSRTVPDLLVVEIADGILERETAMILSDPSFRDRVGGLILAADSSLAALAGVEELRGLGYHVLGASGAFTSAPLYVREFRQRSDVPVLASTKTGDELAASVIDHFAISTDPESVPPSPEPAGGSSAQRPILARTAF